MLGTVLAAHEKSPLELTSIIIAKHIPPSGRVRSAHAVDGRTAATHGVTQLGLPSARGPRDELAAGRR